MELFFADLFQISDDDRDHLFRLQILPGDARDIVASDPANEIWITVRIFQAKLKVFDLSQKARHLALGVQTQGKATGQEVLGLAELLIAHRRLTDAANLFFGNLDRFLSRLVFGLHDELKLPALPFRAEVTVDR